MTVDEWLECEAFILANWQNAKPQTPKNVKLRQMAVDDVPYELGLAVLVQMLRAGRQFPPTSGDVYRAAAEATREPAPAAGEVILLLRQAAGRFGRDNEAGALRWLAERSKHAARFAVEHGWRQWCMEGMDDPEHGGAVRHRIEKSVVGSVAGLEREYREGNVLQLVGRRLQQLDSGTADRGLRRLNPGDVLGASRPELEAGDDHHDDDEPPAGAPIPA